MALLAVTGYPPELDDQTLLLKEPYVRVIIHGEIKLVLTKSILHESQLSEYQKIPWRILGENINSQLCDTLMNVMEVINHFLIGFKAHSIRRQMFDTINLASSLWLKSSQASRITHYYYSPKLT